jgi:hypothetical protein
MLTISAIIAVLALGYAGYKIYENWPRVNSVSDLQTIFKDYNSVDDLKVAFDDAKKKVDDFKAGVEAEIKTTEDKVAALKSLVS